jgi:Holliday junction resolvasome RuvABC endonuclease subunit
MLSMIDNYKPDLIGIEGIQFQEESAGHQMGVTVFQTLARLQGVLIETCVEFDLPFEVAPTNTWRAHCGVKGRSRADKKRSMQMLVKQWYDISVTDDESDAIGIGKFVSETHQQQVEIVSWE